MVVAKKKKIGRWIGTGLRWRWRPALLAEGYEGQMWRRAGSPRVFDYDWPPRAGTGSLTIVGRPSPGGVRVDWDETFAGDHWMGSADLRWIQRNGRVMFFGKWTGHDSKGNTDQGLCSGDIPV